MPSLKDLKNRIESVKSTRKITKAMQMVAAAKLRRAQESAENARPYAERMEAVLGNLASGVANSPSAPRLLAGNGNSQTHLLVVATSERGLCGGFNSSIVKLAKIKVDSLLAEGKTVKILTIGKKGREQLKRTLGDNLIGHVDLSDVKRVGYGDAAAIAHDIINRFNADEFDVCSIFYSRFQNVITQVPTERQLIPAVFDSEESEGGSQYEYEPEEGAILADLLPRGLATHVFTALLENGASEQGARMSAMDNATRNAGEMIDKLTIQYNRSRQAAITTELIEIIAGAEAL
ncbi:F0F1 ATP synthase subunit gamma [Amaricoccus tamworthensis]|uniref:F0F1 ATP synthase subunit gamma n=1 Tax=Amaricoccus tamworthensis TaxID=57002 RepID=UPI003C7D5D6F